MTPEQFEAALTKEEIGKVLFHARNISYTHAEDIAQDAIISAWRGCDRFRQGCKFSTWLYQITKNTGINHHKAVSRRLPSVAEDFDASPQVHHDNPHRALEADRKLSAISSVLSDMKPAKRNAWMIYHTTPAKFEDMPALIGGTVGSNKSRVARANEMVQALDSR
jgi:RNA polymerase sigma-70 factor (ECF subfamily)